MPSDENNNLILSNKRVDIEECIIVDTDDALLVCKKVKEIVLKKSFQIFT